MEFEAIVKESDYADEIYDEGYDFFDFSFHIKTAISCRNFCQ